MPVCCWHTWIHSPQLLFSCCCCWNLDVIFLLPEEDVCQWLKNDNKNKDEYGSLNINNKDISNNQKCFIISEFQSSLRLLLFVVNNDVQNCHKKMAIYICLILSFDILISKDVGSESQAFYVWYVSSSFVWCLFSKSLWLYRQ